MDNFNIEKMAETKNIDDIIESLCAKAKRELRRAIHENYGNLTFFIGNGLSRISGTPSWSKLADMVTKELSDYQVIDFSESDQSEETEISIKTKISIADTYLRDKKLLEEKVKDQETRKKLTYHAIIKKNYKHSPHDPHEKLAKLAKLNPHAIRNFMTTNYDWMLKDAFKKEGLLGEGNKLFYPFYSPKSFKPQANQNILLYLHGSTENESEMIVSIKDYLE